MARLLLGAESEREMGGEQNEGGHPSAIGLYGGGKPPAGGQPVAGGQPAPAAGGQPSGQREARAPPRFRKHLPWHGERRQSPESKGAEGEAKGSPAAAAAQAYLLTGGGGPLASLLSQLTGLRNVIEGVASQPTLLGRTYAETGFFPAGERMTWEMLKRIPEDQLKERASKYHKTLETKGGELAAEYAAAVATAAGTTLENVAEWKYLLGPAMAKVASLAGAGLERALEKTGLVTYEKRVYAPEKVEVITAQQGGAGAAAWKLGKPATDITEKWVMGSPAPRVATPEAPYYKVPVGLKEAGAALKVGELPFSLHPSSVSLYGGGAEAHALLTREGGAVVLKGLPEATLPYAGKQTLSVIFPWEKPVGGAGFGGTATPLVRLPPPSGGAAAAVPTGGGALLSLEKLSTALGGGGVPGATLETVARVAPLPVTLPVLPSSPQAQKQEAGTETVVRTGDETVLRRGDETLPRTGEETLPRRGDETLPRRPEDTVPVPERGTGGTTVAIPREEYPTVAIPEGEKKTVVIPRRVPRRLPPR